MNVKFTTDEGMGFVGRGEGIARAGHGNRRPQHGARPDREYSPPAMDRDDVAFAGAAALARMVREGQVSSRELVELYLDRIGRLDPALNSYRIVMAERALADADQADARAARRGRAPAAGRADRGEGHRGRGRRGHALGHRRVQRARRRDGELVSRLRAAGAVIIGKTNLPELAIIG